MGKETVLNEVDIQSVIEFANNDMRVTTTAKKMYVHRNTLLFRLDKVRRITGLNPCRFADLVKLIEKFNKGE